MTFVFYLESFPGPPYHWSTLPWPPRPTGSRGSWQSRRCSQPGQGSWRPRLSSWSPPVWSAWRWWPSSSPSSTCPPPRCTTTPPSPGSSWSATQTGRGWWFLSASSCCSSQSAPTMRSSQGEWQAAFWHYIWIISSPLQTLQLFILYSIFKTKEKCIS